MYRELSLVLVLNPVQLQLYLVLLSHLPYLVAFYVLVLLSFFSMSLSVYMSYPNSILYPISYVYFIIHIYS